jgi:hypothetical protein
MRIIIDGKIRKDERFRFTQKPGGSGTDRYYYDVFYLENIQISDSRDGNFYLDIDDLNSNVPEQIPEQLIVGYSIQRPLAGCHRHFGIYELGKAKATVDGSNSLGVEVTGTSLEDVRKLYTQIRAGTILPTEDWEAPQTDKAQPGLKKPKLPIIKRIKNFFDNIGTDYGDM